MAISAEKKTMQPDLEGQQTHSFETDSRYSADYQGIEARSNAGGGYPTSVQKNDNGMEMKASRSPSVATLSTVGGMSRHEKKDRARQTLFNLNDLAENLRMQLEDLDGDENGKVCLSDIQNSMAQKKETEKRSKFLAKQNWVLLAIMFVSVVINGAMVAAMIYAFKDNKTSDDGVLTTTGDDEKPVGTASVKTASDAAGLLSYSPMDLDSVDHLHMAEGSRHVSVKPVGWSAYTKDNDQTQTLLFEIEPTKLFGDAAEAGGTAGGAWEPIVAVRITKAAAESDPEVMMLNREQLEKEVLEADSNRRMLQIVGGYHNNEGLTFTIFKGEVSSIPVSSTSRTSLGPYVAQLYPTYGLL